MSNKQGTKLLIGICVLMVVAIVLIMGINMASATFKSTMGDFFAFLSLFLKLCLGLLFVAGLVEIYGRLIRHHKLRADDGGNYEKVWNPITNRVIGPDPGNVAHAEHYSPHYNLRGDPLDSRRVIEGTASERLALPEHSMMTKVEERVQMQARAAEWANEIATKQAQMNRQLHSVTFRALLDKGKISLEPDQAETVLGIKMVKTPVEKGEGDSKQTGVLFVPDYWMGAWHFLASPLIVGLTEGGKSTTATYYGTLAGIGGAKGWLIDPHANGDSDQSLYRRLEPILPYMLRRRRHIASTTRQIRRLVREIHKEYIGRKDGSIPVTYPLVLFVDEFSELMYGLEQRTGKKKSQERLAAEELRALVKEIFTGGRKFGIFAVVIGHLANAASWGGSDLRSAAQATLVHAMDRKSAQTLGLTGEWAAMCEKLQQGELLYWRKNRAFMERIKIPFITHQDVVAVGRYLATQGIIAFMDDIADPQEEIQTEELENEDLGGIEEFEEFDDDEEDPVITEGLEGTSRRTGTGAAAYYTQPSQGRPELRVMEGGGARATTPTRNTAASQENRMEGLPLRITDHHFVIEEEGKRPREVVTSAAKVKEILERFDAGDGKTIIVQEVMGRPSGPAYQDGAKAFVDIILKYRPNSPRLMRQPISQAQEG